MISNLSIQIHELVDLIPLAPSPGQEKGDLCCEGHPHIPRQGLRPCNPFLAFPDQTSSPVVDSHWRDITPIRSRYP